MKTGFPICLLISTHEAFSEDLWIIGLQQENMDSGTTDPRIDINHDGAAMQAIRMLESMIEAGERKTRSVRRIRSVCCRQLLA